MSINFKLVMKRNNIFNYQLLIFLFAFTFFSIKVYSQCIIPNEFVGNTGSNMTLLLQPTFINALNVQSNDAYIVATTQSGLIVGSTSVNVSQTSLAIWGDDSFSPEIDGASEGQSIILSLVVDGIDLINVFPLNLNNETVDISYVTNGFLVLHNADIQYSCTFDPNSGCTDNSACNYNPSATSDNGSCVYLEGQCDICEDGIVIDNDIDNDGICDIDEIPGCMDESACNYNPLATDPPIIFDSELNPMECSYSDEDGDGVCDIFEIVGCTDAFACNYDATSTTDSDNSLCIFATGCDTCSGETDGTGTIVDNDSDDDGVCNDDEVTGCTDSLACTYSEFATEDDNSLCIFATGCDICSGETDGTGTVVDNDLDDDGVCDDDEVMGCTDSLACTYSDLATEDDNSCLYFDSCGECGGNDNCAVFIEADLTIFVDSTLVSDSEALESFENNFEDLMETQLGLPDGCVVVIQINFLSRGDIEIEIVYTITLTEEEIQETEIDPNLTPEEIIIELIEEISVFEDEDVFEDIEFIEGCTNSQACNFNIEANIEAECFVPEGCDVCSGETNDGSGFILTNDSDGDGVCDIDEIIGCTDDLACNYDATSTTDTDNSLCIFATGCDTCSGETDGTGAIVDNDIDDDGVCSSDEIIGCTDDLACNYDATPTTDTDNSLCIFSVGCETCSGEQDGTGFIIDNDLDDDGVCNNDETIGCTDELACNYDATPTTDTDNSLCIFSVGCETCSGEQDGSGYILNNDIDNDGVCNQDEVEGCISLSACNYNDLATDDDGSCIYAVPQYNCDGECIFDSDNDGICNLFEVLGCTDSTYLEYDESATEENGSCQTLILEGCLDNSYLEYNPLANVDVSSLCITPVVLGCLDIFACNYYSEANTDDGSCTFAETFYNCNGDCLADMDGDNICDELEVYGCTDELACNYDATPTTNTDNTLCNYSTELDECATCSGETDGTGTIVDNDIDDDGVCDIDEIIGCTDEIACNYDATSTTDTDNTLCNYSTDLDECATCSGQTDGTGTIVDNDYDDDGICDEVDYDDGIGLNEFINAPINLYPNPSKDFINIDFESNLSNVSVEILNSLGDVLILENLADVSSKYIMQIAVHNLPSGLYLLRVKSDHQLHRVNWIKN